MDSEIEPLEAVLLHCPSRELEELTPRFLEELLFDDIPWLERIREEHRLFARVLEEQGARVFYYRDLLEETLRCEENRKELLLDLMQLHRISGTREKAVLLDFLEQLDSGDLASLIIGGLHKKVVARKRGGESLALRIEGEFNYYLPPLPNLYFTRDPGSIIGGGISVNSMRTPARKGESLLLHHIIKGHPLFRKSEVPHWFGHDRSQSLEGGDILVLSPRVVMIGCSARSSSSAIEELAWNLLQGLPELEDILVMQIPFERAYMHLDTVFTMIHYDAFTIFPGIESHLKLFRLTRSSEDQLKIESDLDLTGTLERTLKLDAVRLIRSGGEDNTTAAREQWNDSTNTLAVAPGRVITYNRNRASNETLDRAGIEVIAVEGSELVRGRGGPRCMSMPLRRKPWREK